MTRQEYNEGIANLSRFYPSMDVPDDTLDAWYSVLKNWSVDVFYGCLQAIVEKETQWASWFNLVGKCGEHREKVVSRLVREREKRKALPPRQDTTNSPEFKAFQKELKRLVAKTEIE